MALTKKEVEHIAGLARTRLTDKEKDKLTKELGSILGYVDKLGEVKTDGVEPTAQVTGLENVFRKDDIRGEATDPTKLIGQFPHKKDSYLKVKPVFETLR